MLRLIVFLAVVVGSAFGFSWLADNPGEVRAVWLGQEVTFSIMVAAIGLAALVAAVIAAWSILTGLLRTPQAVGAFFARRRREKGWQALSRGMVAVGSGDAREAARLAGEARRILGSEPLALLLEAQSAQAEGDHARARATFEAMLDRPETRLLGLRGLYVEAMREGEGLAARHFAEEAHKAAPKLVWAGEAQMQFEAGAGDFEAALATLDRLQRAKHIEKAAARRLRAVLMTGRVLDLEEGQPDPARALALEAHTLAPDLVPAALAAARLLVRSGDVRRASRVLETNWRVEPHPDIADAYLHVRPGDSVKDRLARARELVRVRGHHPEAALMLARAELGARDFAAARATLKPLIDTGPTRRTCLLMAEIDAAEEAGAARVREWLARAVRAPRDPQWIADGHAFEQWQPVSPLSGRIDAFVWATPPEQASDADREVAARLASEVAITPASGPVLADVAATKPAGEPAPAAPSPATPSPAAPPPVAPSSPPPAAPARPAPPPPLLMRAPDDPGPDGADPGDPQGRRL
jgi:HemY protein